MPSIPWHRSSPGPVEEGQGQAHGAGTGPATSPSDRASASRLVASPSPSPPELTTTTASTGRSGSRKTSASPSTSQLVQRGSSHDAGYFSDVIGQSSSSVPQTPSASHAASSSAKVVGKLRVHVIGAHALTGKDRNGLSDPFFVVNLPGAPAVARDRHHYRRTTPVQHKTLNPEWKEGEATFDWDITSDWLPRSPSPGPEAASDESVAVTVPTKIDNDQSSSSLMVPLTEGTTVSLPIAPRSRPSNVRKISAVTGRLLIAPVRISARGAMATGRVVRRHGMAWNGNGGNGRPRPMRLRRGGSSTSHPAVNAVAGSGALAGGHASSAAVSNMELVCWDKDRWSGNDYMGECSISIGDWIPQGRSAEWSQAEAVAVPLVSSRRGAKVSGEVLIRIGIVTLPGSSLSADDLYHDLLEACAQSGTMGIRSVPADQSVGTAGPSDAFVDDGLSSDSEDEEEALEELMSDDGEGHSGGSDDEETATTETDDPYESDQSQPGLAHLHHRKDAHKHDLGKEAAPLTTDKPIVMEPDHMAVPGTATPPTGEQQRHRRRLFPPRLRRSRTGHEDILADSIAPSEANSDVGEDDNGHPSDPLAAGQKGRRRRIVGRRSKGPAPKKKEDAKRRRMARRDRRKDRQRRQDFAFKAEQGLDIIGIVQLEVKSAHDLPRWKNSLGTGFDMDAFCIISFGQRIFRTRVARHSLNPVWDEKLLFHVRRHEANYVTKLAIFDWDKLSSNDYVAETELHVADLLDRAPKPDPVTGLYADEDATHKEMDTFDLPLIRREDGSTRTLGTHIPQLTVQARFTPYAALRQRFWRQLLRQYDSNDSGTLSQLELMFMLESLGSTLSAQTIAGFFTRYDKDGDQGDELTIDEAIIALEGEIVKPLSQKSKVQKDLSTLGLGADTPAGTTTGTQTPSLDADMQGDKLALLSNNDFVGPQAPTVAEPELAARNETATAAALDAPAPTRGRFARPLMHTDSKLSVMSQATAISSSSGGTSSLVSPERKGTGFSINTDGGETSSHAEGDALPASSSDHQVERVIRLQSCPMCRMPRLSKKAEVDIVTHLAVCASQDWRRVDSIMVSNYVTAIQAHRKWFTKIFSKISQGQYQLGANSANIIVQDRKSGEMLEEKMQVYVRLGIRLLYKGARSRMEGARIRRMLHNMSVKQGRKFDSPLSAREIPHFIAFHSLDLDEVLEPLENFKTFNQFFYRKLKPDARPVADPDDPRTLVSAADCRFMAFATVTAATQLWIKGRGFTIDKLLGPGFLGQRPHDLDRYHSGGGLCIFRLAPQDYHRYHCPADATVGKITMIDGQYYTVNPMAIRSAIDVYCENVRAIVPFHSEQFGTFYCVCIGAMMVGSIILTVKEGQTVRKGDEMGYFAFGGSTLVLVFEQDRVTFDTDLLQNSEKAIETLVQVGMRIGRTSEGEQDGSTVDEEQS